jgi:hypothetical protein
MNYNNVTENVARLVADPDTPAEIYNSLTETVLEMTDRHNINVFHPAVLRVALPLALERESGGTRVETETPQKYQRHADIIADLLESKETPEVLRSTLIEFCSELSNWTAQNGECVCSVETTRKHLAAIFARAEVRGIRSSPGGVMFDKGGRRHETSSEENDARK